MIKELWHWIWQLIKGLFTFKYSRISYDVTNLYWYLRYGFAYWDIQDMDQYLAQRINKMLPLFRKYTCGIPDQMSAKQYYDDLHQLEHLAGFIFTAEFEDLHWNEQINIKNRFLNLLKKHFYHLWF